MVILPYVAIACFIIGTVYRVFTWSRAPSSQDRSVVFPNASNKFELILEFLKDILFFPRLYKVDKKLWLGAWLLHYGLLLTLIGHVRLLFEWQLFWEFLSFDAFTIDSVALISGSLAGIIMLSTVIYLLGRRLMGSVSNLSRFEDYFVLVVLLGIGITGMYMRLFILVDLDQFRNYLVAILTFQPPSIYPDVGPIFLVHLLLVLISIAILPFSKLFHLGGIFVTIYSKYRPEEN
jgi:nitrate reductase gamma subunit